MAGRPYVQAGIGEPPIRMISSILADQTSAYQLANLVMARWGDDSAWESPTVIVRHQLLSPAERADVAALEPGDELITGGMGAAPGTPGAGRWRVEGWQETWDRGDGDGAILRVQQFAVSDAVRWRTDPGQLTRTAVQILTPGPYEYSAAGVPLTIRFDAVPADGQPPERPMTDGTFTLFIDGIVAYRAQFEGRPMTANISSILMDVGEHTLTARYDGVWGVWSDSEASVTYTVVRGTPTLRLVVLGSAYVGGTLLLNVAGDPYGVRVWVEEAEQGAPDEWVRDGQMTTGVHMMLGAIDRPLRMRVVFEGNANWLPMTSNVITVGWSWQLVADQHATWQDVADTHTDWADVAERG
jgi:hypothetical protein